MGFPDNTSRALDLIPIYELPLPSPSPKHVTWVPWTGFQALHVVIHSSLQNTLKVLGLRDFVLICMVMREQQTVRLLKLPLLHQQLLQFSNRSLSKFSSSAAPVTYLDGGVGAKNNPVEQAIIAARQILGAFIGDQP